MADPGDEEEQEPNAEEEENLQGLVDRIPIVGESNGELIAKVIHTGPLTDAEYNNMLVRMNETSLDGLVRQVVTNNRSNMAAIDRSTGNFRRWLQSTFYYVLAWEDKWVADGDPVVKKQDGRPIPRRKKGRIEVDKDGEVLLEMEYPEPKWGRALSRKWIEPNEAKELLKTGSKLITSDEEKKLRKEEKHKFFHDPLEYGPFQYNPLEYEGIIVKERLWFLSGSQTERNIIGPREVMTKIPKRTIRKFVKFLERLQTSHPETPIKDFYGGVFPEKWLPKDQWVEILKLEKQRRKPYNPNRSTEFLRALGQSFKGIENPDDHDDKGEPRLRLGSLVVTTSNGAVSLPNYYELGKVAEYYLGELYFPAKVRFAALRAERNRIIREFFNSRGRKITDSELTDRIDKAYQWWLPFVQYQFVNKWIPGKARLDKDPSQAIDRIIPARERANANFDAVEQISFIVVEPEQIGPGKVDLSTAVIYFPINEEIRDIARMVGHFQQCKAQKWRFDKFNYEKGDMNNAVGADHGGAMSGGKMGDDLIFELCEEKLTDWVRVYSLTEKERWKLRRALFGPVQSLDKDSSRLTAQEMYGEFGLRRVDITDGAREARSLIPGARKGIGLKWDRDTLTKKVVGLRQYPGGHGEILKGETYFWYDPWDITKNNGGLRSDAMVNSFTNRLWIYGTTDTGAPLIRIADVVKLRQDGKVDEAKVIERLHKRADKTVRAFEPVELEWFDQQEIYRELVFKQPAKNLIPRLVNAFHEYKLERIVHIRPHLRKDFLVGLPDSVWDDPRFTKAVEDLNYRSDQRVLDWAGWKSHGLGTVAVRGLSQNFHDPFFADGFGTDNGLPDFLQVELCANLAIMGWYNSQFDSAVKLARQITYNHSAMGQVTEQYDLVQKSIGGGLHPDIAIAVAECLTLGKSLKWDVFLQKEKPSEVSLVEKVFHELEALHLGRERMQIVKEGGVFRAMMAA